MKTLRYLPFLLLVFLMACVGNLDSINKRFAGFEIYYKQTLAQIDTLEKSNSFKPETKLKVADLLEDVNKARKAAYVAKDSGDILNAQDQLSLAIALLDRLKTMVPTEGQI